MCSTVILAPITIVGYLEKITAKSIKKGQLYLPNKNISHF